MYFELALLAYLIDMAIGELPGKHPVAWLGDFIQAFEKSFYRPKILPGALLVISSLTLSIAVASALVYVCSLLPAPIAFAALALLSSTGLAMHMLHASVAGVLRAENPKQAISRLVSRDTGAMTDADINKAALETWAENLSDGVIAPLFYLVLFGLPGIAAYKAVNTLDSMVAYKNERYFYFGKIAAITDDLANFIPARLTALLIVISANNRKNAWLSMIRDGNKLESPNAGYPIAAMAGALDIALGGDAYYHGKLKHKPILGTPHGQVDRNAVMLGLRMRKRLDALVVVLLTIGAWMV